MLPKITDYLSKHQQGIRIDMGCGAQKQPDFFGIDLLPLPGVDLVWDLEKVPYPLPGECASMILASHIIEHLNPHKGLFLKVMDEWWRLLKAGGTLAIATPYAGSPGYWQDPTHINPCNETTFYYFDPEPTNYEGDYLYQFYEPKPWKVKSNVWKSFGNLEIVMEKRSLEEGKKLLKKYKK